MVGACTSRGGGVLGRGVPGAWPQLASDWCKGHGRGLCRGLDPPKRSQGMSVGGGTALWQGALEGVGLGNMGSFDLWYRRGEKTRGTAARGRCTQRLCSSCLLCPHSAGKSQPLASVTCSTQHLGDARLPCFHSSARTGLNSGIYSSNSFVSARRRLGWHRGLPPAFSGLAWNKLCKYSLGLLQELEMSQVMAEMPLCCVALPGFPCCPLWPTLPG